MFIWSHVCIKVLENKIKNHKKIQIVKNAQSNYNLSFFNIIEYIIVTKCYGKCYGKL